MKTLLIITTSYPFGPQGSEAAGSFVQDMALELSSGLKVVVMAPGLDKGVEQVNDQLLIYRYKTSGKPLSGLMSSRSIAAVGEILTIIKQGRTLAHEICQAHGVDHILALWALPSGWWARSAGARNGIPYSIWALGSDIWSLGKLPVIRSVLSSVLNGAGKLYADGIELSRQVERLAPARTCEFLPSVRKHPVDVAKSRVKTSSPYQLTFVGRWHRNKGVDILLDALEHMDNEGWQHISNITIAGGGMLEPEVTEAIGRLKAAGRPVMQLGFLSKEDVMVLFNQSDFVLIPSRIESVPLVLTDAVRAQAPVVSMPVGDLKELITEFDLGYIADDVSTKAYLDVLKMALETGTGSLEYARQAYLERFSLEHTSTMVHQLLVD